MRAGLVVLTMLSMPHTAVSAPSVLTTTTEALEGQLACRAAPKPALAIRTMIHNGLLSRTQVDPAGVPIFRPTRAITVFGKPLLFVSGWEMES